MRAYLDASVLVALFTLDALTARSLQFMQTHAPIVVVSDFAMAEFVSAIARKARMSLLAAAEAQRAFASLDAWALRTTKQVEATPGDVRRANAVLRRLDLGLRTPDALNIAIAERVGATMATADAKMASSARALGLAVAAV